MIILFLALFVFGFYLFGVGITIGSALVFIAGLLSVCLGVAMCLHLPGATKKSHS